MDQKKNKLVKSWVKRHVSDHYVHLAKKDGYRSRASYKLLELDKKFNLFKNVKTVVDLGCAPGSWSQVLCQKFKAPDNIVIGLDLLPIEAIDGLTFIQGDFTENAVLDELLLALKSRSIDLILSDMSPNLSGVKVVDQSRSAYLVELVLELARVNLKVYGNCAIKVFQGAEFATIVKTMREIFTEVISYKPDASRSESSEVYLLGMGKK